MKIVKLNLVFLLFATFLSANSNYIQISSGVNFLDSIKKDNIGSVSLDNKQDKIGSNVLVEFAYIYSKKLDFSINYQKVFSDDISYDNVFISSKYKFKDKGVIPYTGINLGVSRLNWEENPINTTKNDTSSTSYILGVSAGLVYELSSNIALDLNYQINSMKHSTKLEQYPNSSTLEHNYFQTINLGIRYSF